MEQKSYGDTKPIHKQVQKIKKQLTEENKEPNEFIKFTKKNENYIPPAFNIKVFKLL